MSLTCICVSVVVLNIGFVIGAAWHRHQGAR